MPNLRFDTDMGRDMSSKMGTCAGNIEAELQSAMSSADALVPGSWEAPAANQFHEEMNNWAGAVRNAIEALQQLQQRLNAEIDQWEATGQGF